MRAHITSHLAPPLSSILIAACLCGCSKRSTAEPGISGAQVETSPAGNAPHRAPPRTEQPKEIVEIEQAIAANASDESVRQQVVKAEGMIIEHIRAKGPGDRFVIKDVSAQDEGQKASVCLNANPQGGAMVKTEFPGDKIRIDLSFAGIVAYGEGSRWVPNIFQQTPNGMVTSPDVPGGDGSIHRYAGAIPLGVGVEYIVIGDTNTAQRLTFALLKDIGYVYVRGNGKVIGPKGQVKLGSE